MSYDTVAASYADLLSGELTRQPYHRAVLGLFAEFVHSGGGPAASYSSASTWATRAG